MHTWPLGTATMHAFSSNFKSVFWCRVDYEAGLQEVCNAANCNVGLLPYSPLAGGVLSGKYSQVDASDDKAAKWRLNLFTGESKCSFFYGVVSELMPRTSTPRRKGRTVLFVAFAELFTTRWLCLQGTWPGTSSPSRPRQ